VPGRVVPHPTTARLLSVDPTDGLERRGRVDRTRALTRRQLKRLLPAAVSGCRANPCGDCSIRLPLAPISCSPWTWRAWI
jgi:hypothetical protein